MTVYSFRGNQANYKDIAVKNVSLMFFETTQLQAVNDRYNGDISKFFSQK